MLRGQDTKIRISISVQYGTEGMGVLDEVGLLRIDVEQITEVGITGLLVFGGNSDDQQPLNRYWLLICQIVKLL